MIKPAVERTAPTSSNGIVRVGGREVVVHDPNEVEAVSADVMTEARELNGICALSFATVVSTSNGSGASSVEAVVCARLRLSLAAAMRLHNVLERMLKKSMPAKRDIH